MPLVAGRGQAVLFLFVVLRKGPGPPAGPGRPPPRAWAQTRQEARRQSRAALPSMVPCKYEAWRKRRARPTRRGD
eukprot:4724954-Lingulodinium_polyedra.AAC.1